MPYLTSEEIGKAVSQLHVREFRPTHAYVPEEHVGQVARWRREDYTVEKILDCPCALCSPRIEHSHKPT